MDAEESEESSQYPYLGPPLSKEAESVAPDLLERDYAADKGLLTLPLPLPQDPGTPHRYSEDPTSPTMSDESPETRSYGSPSPSGVIPGMGILDILGTSNRRCRMCSKNLQGFLFRDWFCS